MVSALASINEVNQRRARLVLRWVTVSWFNSRCGTFISVCDQSNRSTQSGYLFVGRRNEYQPKGGDALRLGSKGRYGMWVAGKTVRSPRYTRPISEHLSSGASHNKALYKYPDYSKSKVDSPEAKIKATGCSHRIFEVMGPVGMGKGGGASAPNENVKKCFFCCKCCLKPQ